MAGTKYVIHKIGFHYTDECFVAENSNGSVVEITNSLEEAKEIKRKYDIESLKKFVGTNIVELFFYDDDVDDKFDNIKQYFEKNDLTEFVEEDSFYIEMPEDLTFEQVNELFDIINKSFHNIIEYNEEITLEQFSNISRENNLDEF